MAISFTNNVFTGFIFGIKKGPFPFTISLRHEDEQLMVFDDLLALTPCHLNCIPATSYIPDWRYLLRKPKAGLALIQSMYDQCFNVLKTSFFANKAWRTQHFRDGASMTEADLRECLMAGFNYPPSQYQLHLQFMVLPLLPFHYHMYLKGTHFTKDRFYPVNYVQEVLRVASQQKVDPMDVTDDTPIEEIVAKFNNLGVDYDAYHAEAYKSVELMQVKRGNFQASQFEGVVCDGKYTSSVAGAETRDANALIEEDKCMLQNYGRPYKNGKPTGCYYSKSKSSLEVAF